MMLDNLKKAISTGPNRELIKYHEVVTETLRAEITQLRAELATLRAENERLRYYLRAILESDDVRFTWPREMAKEALK